MGFKTKFGLILEEKRGEEEEKRKREKKRKRKRRRREEEVKQSQIKVWKLTLIIELLNLSMDLWFV